MRKHLLIVLFIFVFIFALVGCDGGSSDDKKVIGIKVNDDSETAIGDFDYDNAKFTIVYQDGSTIDVTSSEVQIDDTDFEKLFETGVHSCKLTYKGEVFTSKIIISENEEDKSSPSSSFYFVTKSHYIDGKQYTSFYVGGDGTIDYYGFEFKLNYDNEAVKNIEIVINDNMKDNVEYKVGEDNIAFNFVSSKKGEVNAEIFRIEYDSAKLYKNFILDVQNDYGFYKLTGQTITIINAGYNFNW